MISIVVVIIFHHNFREILAVFQRRDTIEWTPCLTAPPSKLFSLKEALRCAGGHRRRSKAENAQGRTAQSRGPRSCLRWRRPTISIASLATAHSPKKEQVTGLHKAGPCTGQPQRNRQGNKLPYRVLINTCLLMGTPFQLISVFFYIVSLIFYVRLMCVATLV